MTPSELKADAAKKLAAAKALMQQAEDEAAEASTVAPDFPPPPIPNAATIVGDQRVTTQPSLLQTLLAVAQIGKRILTR